MLTNCRHESTDRNTLESTDETARQERVKIRNAVD